MDGAASLWISGDKIEYSYPLGMIREFFKKIRYEGRKGGMILFRSIWNNCIFFTRDNNDNNRGLFNKFEKNLVIIFGWLCSTAIRIETRIRIFFEHFTRCRAREIFEWGEKNRDNITIYSNNSSVAWGEKKKKQAATTFVLFVFKCRAYFTVCSRELELNDSLSRGGHGLFRSARKI